MGTKSVSLIIPCNHPDGDLIELLKAVLMGSLIPDEILVIRSGTKEEPIEAALRATELSIVGLSELQIPTGISIRFCDVSSAFPGAARNIGIGYASCDLIAFLDVKTIPTEEWLEDSLRCFENLEIDGVWGLRSYYAITPLAGLLRDAIYGRRPVRSLAGTICRKEVFNVTGRMIGWSPAGEDGDWIHRVEAHNLTFISNDKANHFYRGLDNKPLLFFVRKWWQYYHYSRLLAVNQRDRFLSYGLLYVALLFFAFNWNFKISVALLGSPFVIPHVTTGLAIAGPLLYFIVRALYLPLRRGTPFFQVFPTRFILIFMIAFVLDFVKTFALIIPAGFAATVRPRKL